MHPFTKHFADSVSAWGEQKLLVAIRGWLGSAAPHPPFGMGDDCAVLPATRGRQLITVDPVIYGRHFDDTVPARAVGEKLLKRNLSDLAAMGGTPTAAVLALTLDARVSRKWLEQFYRGLAACARHYGVSLVGGDIAQADGLLAASLTLLGRPAGSRILTRSGSRAGDRIYVTGVLGGSLRSGHHFRFTPRLAEGAWLARHLGVQAMMDLSDGLAKDLPALTPRGAVPALDPAALPRRAGVSLAAALGDGEDYELAFSFAARGHRVPFERAWEKTSPARVFPVSDVSSHPATRLLARSISPPTVATNIFDKLRAGVITACADDTQSLAAELAAALPSEVTLALHGNLGVGKTTFVQGLARGFGMTETVTSPTFNIYTVHLAKPGARGGTRTLVHLDAYRLDRAQQVEDLLLEDFLVSPWCLAIEWPEKISAWLPSDAWHIDLGIAPDERHTLQLRLRPGFPDP